MLCLTSLVALLGCGSTEESGAIGETLEAKGLSVAVERIDFSVPTDADDVTGLSKPAPGFELVGARVRVCSDHGGAIGPYDFGLDTGSGEAGRLKYPQSSYPGSFDSMRTGCGSGWVVFEVPNGSEPSEVAFRFEDTGSARQGQNNVDARFSWTIGSGQ